MFPNIFKILSCNQYIKSIDEFYILFIVGHHGNPMCIWRVACLNPDQTHSTCARAAGCVGSLPSTARTTLLCSATFSGSLLPDLLEPAAYYSDLCFCLSLQHKELLWDLTGHLLGAYCVLVWRSLLYVHCIFYGLSINLPGTCECISHALNISCNFLTILRTTQEV